MPCIPAYSFDFFGHKCGNMPWKSSLWANGCDYAGKLCESRLWHRPTLQVVVVLALERLNSAKWCADREGTSRIRWFYFQWYSFGTIQRSSINHDHGRVYPNVPVASCTVFKQACNLSSVALKFTPPFVGFYWSASGHLLAFNVNDSLPLFATILHHLAVSDSIRSLLRHALPASNATGKACKGSCHGGAACRM